MNTESAGANKTFYYKMIPVMYVNHRLFWCDPWQECTQHTIYEWEEISPPRTR